MKYLLQLLGGAAGPYLVGGVAVMLALSLAFGQAQTMRLHHAKGDLVTAKAALIDPATRKSWKDEALATQRDLGTCQGNVARLDGALARQTAAVADLQAKSEAWLSASRKAAQDARAVAESYRRGAREILAAKAGADKCGAAESLILEAVK